MMRQPNEHRILVVDDAPANLQGLSALLRGRGYQVRVALDGRQALDLVERFPPDLVLLDVLMPGLDGFGVLEHLKNGKETRHIPVIMISALSEMDNVVRCVEMGAEDYLPKPFNATLLHARIGACLEKKALRDAEQRHLRTIEETQRRLAAELAEAAHYVRSILPEPMQSPLAVDWRYQPSTELGGDAFGYHWIDLEHFVVYLLDVCGHGVGASLLSVTAINVIRSGSLPGTDFRDPGAVLTALNNAFPMERQNNMYFTLWYGVYHAPTRTLRYSSAGHPPALLMDSASGCPRRLRTQGLFVGAMEGLQYETLSCPVRPGDRLLVLCDGCYEVQDASGNVMEFEAFEQFMHLHATDPDALDHLLTWIRQRHGEGPLADDFSIVRVAF